MARRCSLSGVRAKPSPRTMISETTTVAGKTEIESQANAINKIPFFTTPSRKYILEVCNMFSCGNVEASMTHIGTVPEIGSKVNFKIETLALEVWRPRGGSYPETQTLKSEAKAEKTFAVQ